MGDYSKRYNAMNQHYSHIQHVDGMGGELTSIPEPADPSAET
ncbi:hypothetical protein KIPB_013734, partial [Kipferlia bialata]|eukprot:g13734.t1